MKPSEQPTASIPLHDYDNALKSAVSWLGDRYLLAEPLHRRANERKGYFVEAKRRQDARDTRNS